MSEPEDTVPDSELVAVLERARDHGAVGPGPIEPQIAHARGFVDLIAARAPAAGWIVDLGSGGGLPGLVIASDFPRLRVTLVEAIARRARDLEEAVAELFERDRGAVEPARVEVLEARAEDVARRPSYRERVDVVTARGFGRPALVAEVATGLLRIGGVLIVSEPPAPDPARWPAEQLAALGMAPASVGLGRETHYAVIPKDSPAPHDRPRPTRRLMKRPAW